MLVYQLVRMFQTTPTCTDRFAPGADEQIDFSNAVRIDVVAPDDEEGSVKPHRAKAALLVRRY